MIENPVFFVFQNLLQAITSQKDILKRQKKLDDDGDDDDDVCFCS